MNYSKIINEQRKFFNTNQTKELSFRIEQLKKLKKLLKEKESDFYEAIYKDFKKSEFDTYAAEISFIYDEINTAIKKLPKWAKRKRNRTNMANLPAKSYTITEPLGVCLVIGAWNYPYQLSLVPMITAIAAGNTVILKPSEIPSATSIVMTSLINDNFPSKFLCIVEGGIPETTALLKEKFDKIFFTGSTVVGKIVYQAAAKHLTPVTLELGGKSPAIITKDINIKETAKRIVWSKFLNAGQTCIAPDYILVEKEIEIDLLKALKEQITTFDYSFENDNYVQIINTKNFNRLASLIDKDKTYCGGVINASTRFISPTILTNVSLDNTIMKDEIFGPILPVISYSNLDEIISKIKARPKPLSLYIFTKNKTIRDKILHEISFGGGAINDAVMHITNNYLAFGGVGESGIGSYHGEAGFKDFSHFKSILQKPFGFEPNFKYPPYTKKKLDWIRKILGN
ncbi:MAG: aldehyde dehydrogenase [Flavobacteriaceae bacterium]|nr:aldehyde dehydrogenase [Flavobacteriaceae bacterium]